MELPMHKSSVGRFSILVVEKCFRFTLTQLTCSGNVLPCVTCILSRSENPQKCSFLAGTIPGELGELLENLQKRNCKIMSKIAEFNSTTKKCKNSKMEDLGVGMTL